MMIDKVQKSQDNQSEVNRGIVMISYSDAYVTKQLWISITLVTILFMIGFYLARLKNAPIISDLPPFSGDWALYGIGASAILFIVCYFIAYLTEIGDR